MPPKRNANNFDFQEVYVIVYPVLFDIVEPDPILESAGGGSLFGIFLGIAVVVLVVLVVIQAIMKRRKK